METKETTNKSDARKAAAARGWATRRANMAARAGMAATKQEEETAEVTSCVDCNNGIPKTGSALHASGQVCRTPENEPQEIIEDPKPEVVPGRNQHEIDAEAEVGAEDLGAAETATATTKPAKVKTEKTAKVKKTAEFTGPLPTCLCGCGKPVGSASAIFLQGHDATTKSKLLKIYNGTMKPEEIPFAAWEARDKIKFLKSRPEFETAMKDVGRFYSKQRS